MKRWIAFLILPVAAMAADPARKPPPWEKPRETARYLFLENCSVCHEAAKPKSQKIGPSLFRFKQAAPERTKAFQRYIMTKIQTGGMPMPPLGVAMPSFKDALTEEQMAAIAAYLLPDR